MATFAQTVRHPWDRPHGIEDAFGYAGAGHVVNVPKPPEPQYSVAEVYEGKKSLLIFEAKVIARFNTFKDAQLAAKALNEHKGL